MTYMSPTVVVCYLYGLVWPTFLPPLLSVICKVSCDLLVSHRCFLLFVRSRVTYMSPTVVVCYL